MGSVTVVDPPAGRPGVELEARILEYLDLDPRKVETQALLAVCRRYNLDPLLRHVVLVEGRTYITRDGMIAVAHDSGHFAGLEVDAVVEDDDGWTTTATVWRDDMPRPFRYPGRAEKVVKGDTPKRAAQRLQAGPKMAIKDAELTALRRAFNVAGADSESELDAAAGPLLDERPASREQLDRIQRLAQGLTDDQRAQATVWREDTGIDWRAPTADEAAAAIAYLLELTADGLAAEADTAG